MVYTDHLYDLSIEIAETHSYSMHLATVNYIPYCCIFSYSEKLFSKY